KSDGTVWAWGRNDRHQLGRGRDSSEQSSTPEGVLSWPSDDLLSGIGKISAGYKHTLALNADGKILSWGDELRNEIAYAKARFVVDHDDVGGITDIVAADGFSLALNSVGHVLSWGDHQYFQLGRTPCFDLLLHCDADHPTVIPELEHLEISDIAAGSKFGLARSSDGTVFGWGTNDFGQLAGVPGLGLGIPTEIQMLNEPQLMIAAGGDTALAMPLETACSVGNGNIGGRLLAWGDNTSGNRGDGTGVNWVRPTPVLTLGDSEVCSALNGHRLIIYKKGTGSGTIESSAPGLNCTGMICWQAVDVDTEITLTATPDTNSIFTEWRWDCSTGNVFIDNNPEINLVMDGLKHCKAHFDQNIQYQLTVSLNGNGLVTSDPDGIYCGIDCQANFAEGTSITLTAEADAGNEFVAWSGDDTCDDNIDPTDAKRATISMNANINCTATFEADEVLESGNDPIITINVFGDSVNSSVTISDVAGVQSAFECDTDLGICGMTYDPDTTLTLDTTLETGYTFSWSGGSECGVLANTNSTSFNLTLLEDMNVICRLDFEPIVSTNSLYLNTSGSGSGSIFYNNIECVVSIDGQGCNLEFDENDVIELRATASTGSVFAGWGAGCPAGSNATYTLTMPAENVTCVATFNPVATSVEVTVQNNALGNGTITSDPAGFNCHFTGSTPDVAGCETQSFASGTNLKLIATPDITPRFEGWGAVGDGDICDREPDTGPTVFSCEIDNVTSDMTAIFLMVQ
ncbi:MAG: hypothetical protein GY727_03530, partial [Gammaproteobacteria bacterium]|nr:hypothetical protein [Gammaproteobacteria bacterium]